MTRTARSESSPSTDPLFAVAMLRIALELKKNPEAQLEQVASQVAARMHLDELAFRRYLEVNLGLLRTSTQRLAAPLKARAAAPARVRRTQRG